MTRLSEHTVALILLHEVQAIQGDMYKPFPYVQWRQSRSRLYCKPHLTRTYPKLPN